MQDDQVGSETEDDVKRKFREALERKKQASREHRAREENRSKINGTRRSADRKRSFRRKAG